MAPQVSAILITKGDRPEVYQVADDLKQYPFIDEIEIVRPGQPDLMVYARYDASKKAKNNLIYVQDDDCIVHNIRAMYELWDDTRFINAVKASRRQDYSGMDTLVGWGAFFDKRWVVPAFDKYLKLFKEDSLLYREADRIFTSLLDVPRWTINADVTDYDCANSASSLGMQRDHNLQRQEALRRCKRVLEMERARV